MRSQDVLALVVHGASTSDPNWLLSTLVQSTAALVAILGGFLISRVLGATGERAGLRRRRTAVADQLALRRVDVARYEDRLLAWDAGDWVRDILKDLVAADEPSFDDFLLRHAAMGGHSPAELRPFFEEALAAVARCRDLLQGRDPSNLPSNASEARDRGIVVPESDEVVFEAVVGDMERRHAEQARARSPYPSLAGAVVSMPRPARAPEYVVLEIAEYRQLRRDRDDAARDITRMDTELDALRDELARLTRPSGLRTGIGILVYMTIAGLIAPLAAMGLQPRTLAPWMRAALVVAFAVGTMSLAGFLIRALARLDHDQPR